MTFMRILASALPAWEALGWRPVAGHVSPSVGVCVLVEWAGDGEPVTP
jgi:hypothetical protein